MSLGTSPIGQVILLVGVLRLAGCGAFYADTDGGAGAGDDSGDDGGDYDVDVDADVGGLRC